MSGCLLRLRAFVIRMTNSINKECGVSSKKKNNAFRNRVKPIRQDLTLTKVFPQFFKINSNYLKMDTTPRINSKEFLL
jgi:hypothetical protein